MLNDWCWCWVLAVGCWVLGVGCWVLGVGCWVLGVGLDNQDNIFSPEYRFIRFLNFEF
jgi:hypothetical protein